MKQKARHARPNCSTHLVTSQISIFLLMKTAENCCSGMGPKELLLLGKNARFEVLTQLDFAAEKNELQAKNSMISETIKYHK